MHKPHDSRATIPSCASATGPARRVDQRAEPTAPSAIRAASAVPSGQKDPTGREILRVSGSERPRLSTRANRDRSGSANPGPRRKLSRVNRSQRASPSKDSGRNSRHRARAASRKRQRTASPTTSPPSCASLQGRRARPASSATTTVIPGPQAKPVFDRTPRMTAVGGAKASAAHRYPFECGRAPFISTIVFSSSCFSARAACRVSRKEISGRTFSMRLSGVPRR